MLDKLLVSKQIEDYQTVRWLLALTTVVVTMILTLSMIASLFSQSLAVGHDGLNLTALIAPPALPEEAPADSEQKKPDADKPLETKSDKPVTRSQNILRTEEHPVSIPGTISTSRPTSLARPNGVFNIGVDSNDTSTEITSTGRCTSNCAGPGIGDAKTPEIPVSTPDPVKPAVTPPPQQKPVTPPVKSGGVVNGLAKNLVSPGYPAVAKAMRIAGRVTVQVLISEDGDVISANAIDGHTVLRAPAERAAKMSKFTSTTLTGIPVKVRGLIVYNFRP